MSDEWTDLGTTWRDEGPSVGDIEARVRRDVTRVRVRFAVEWIAGALLTAFWLWQGIRHPGPLTLVMGSGSVTFAGVWLFVLHRTLRPPSPAVSMTAYLAGALDRAQSEERWFRFVQRFLLALGLFFAPCSVWLFDVHRSMYLAEPWRAVVGFGGFVILSAGLWGFAGSRRARASAAAAALVESLRRLSTNVAP